MSRWGSKPQDEFENGHGNPATWRRKRSALWTDKVAIVGMKPRPIQGQPLADPTTGFDISRCATGASTSRIESPVLLTRRTETQRPDQFAIEEFP